MRILKFFFFSLFGLGIFGSIAFFLGREVLLVWASTVLRVDYEFLSKKSYGEECVRQFSYGQDYSTQIRFTSNKNYNLEIVCADFISSPIILSTKKLPPLVYKTSFGSGFIRDDEELPNFVELTSLLRKLFVYTEGNKMHSSYFVKPDLDYNNGPVSTCQAHNYQCCSLDLQSGLGEQFTEVNDCPKSCYQSCLLRPVILSFNTRPSMDDATRTVEINAGEVITFSYVIGNGKKDVFQGQLSTAMKESFFEKVQTILNKENDGSIGGGIALPLDVVIDFGDGNQFKGENAQETFDHNYVCQNKTCYFQATISVADARGVLSVDNELANMVIKVNN